MGDQDLQLISEVMESYVGDMKEEVERVAKIAYDVNARQTDIETELGKARTDILELQKENESLRNEIQLLKSNTVSKIELKTEIMSILMQTTLTVQALNVQEGPDAAKKSNASMQQLNPLHPSAWLTNYPQVQSEAPSTSFVAAPSTSFAACPQFTEFENFLNVQVSREDLSMSTGMQQTSLSLKRPNVPQEYNSSFEEDTDDGPPSISKVSKALDDKRDERGQSMNEKEKKEEKSPKFFWKTNRIAEKWLGNMCAEYKYSRSKETKHDIFKKGVEEKLWPDTAIWRLRVHTKIDTICKQLRDNVSTPK